MRWSIIRLIWLRELRDQLRDRRTLFMIAVLPLLLYPILGLALIEFAVSFVDKPSIVGIVGSEHLPGWTPLSAGLSPATPTTLVAAGADASLDRLLGSLALARVAAQRQQLDFPPLLLRDQFSPQCFDT